MQYNPSPKNLLVPGCTRGAQPRHLIFQNVEITSDGHVVPPRCSWSHHFIMKWFQYIAINGHMRAPNAWTPVVVADSELKGPLRIWNGSNNIISILITFVVECSFIGRLMLHGSTALATSWLFAAHTSAPPRQTVPEPSKLACSKARQHHNLCQMSETGRTRLPLTLPGRRTSTSGSVWQNAGETLVGTP